MSFGLDYVTGPPIADMKAAGVTFVCRYLSFVNNLTQVKILSPNEAKALSSAGISIVSNYEWYANRALEGFASGVADAQIAALQHGACGGPLSRPIYFSVDVDTSGAQVADYFKGVASVIGKARTGAYGSYRVLNDLFNMGLITWGWQTYAWSGGAWLPGAHIQQYLNGVSMSGHSVDYNRSIKSDFGQWPVGGKTIMTIDINTPGVASYFTSNAPGWWQCKNGRQIHGKILQEYQKFGGDALCGLTYLGLPLSDEISLDASGASKQYYERGCLVYDPSHMHDHPPGAGIVYAAQVYGEGATGEDPLVSQLKAQIATAEEKGTTTGIDPTVVQKHLAAIQQSAQQTVTLASQTIS